MKGKRGTSMGGSMPKSSTRRKREAAARRAEERRWERLAGPVTVRQADDPHVEHQAAVEATWQETNPDE